jgi:exopolysaccharide biosynthesis polyprenyl glycosylphosphotransferase
VVIASSDSVWKVHLLDTLARAAGTVDRARGNVLLLPGPFDSMVGRMRYRWVRDIPLIEVIRDSEWRLFRPVKRTLDLLVGSALLVLSSPLMLVCGLLIKATSPGTVFYRQERMGKGLERFTLWKLRTMREDAEAESGERLASPEDSRLTPVGATLRRYRLDELPQLFNVLGGSMSLVGPRPERPGFVARYLEEVPGYAERFSVSPGLTGLAQINGEYHSTAQNKLRYDLAYIANWSLWLDLAILVRTIKIVLTSRGI